ncbi:ShlB/FhaC/HecB family hemolysin secretion/activation protein [Stutzerimonas kirkiae]|uniref:ShlB/FhaC/HecB family hemolysin secretion/activation protein n=2 Tax=Stutzerimonas kirkiae TaxID=2211392 RepID=A0A4Q9REF2_9GAMM|nr:ShlB/FhaC/HecB family hemolysin secretion/activation protein [Stutzerimonas kirkiae]TBV05822.1 ShlB/FhaC/HecB family hemolysin secretion/activation protein [Stutzerimonas kirkiae]TBV10597.1 ShlB/FhaC/HecB family hemolysin secretion/activation protein [Stutzerimonas kirkiae]TBV17618.1 ShlB/FhaC/HecB family hemolysin secretion/activation protein [Stutzerimonas kirkiae]
MAQLPSAAEPGRRAPVPVMPELIAPGAPILVPQAPAVQAPAGAENFTFRLEELLIEGVTVFSKAELEPLYLDRIGQQVSVRDLFAIANELEVKYRNAGYVTTRVLVPAQEIDGGRFRIQVIEGFVSEVVLPDDIGPAKAAVLRLIEPLRELRPISVAAIERRLLLANDLAGLDVRGSLEPSQSELGGSLLVVSIERKAVDSRVALDNRNSRYLGDAGLSASASLNAFGSRADRLTLNARTSIPLERSWSVGGVYEAQLGSNGLSGSFASSFANSKPGLELDELDVESQVISEVATLSYPLIRSRRENLRLFGEFEYRNVYTDIADDAFNRDRLRILRGGVSYDRADGWDGISALRATLHQGLDLMNATDEGSPYASRFNGRSDFTKLTLDLTRIQQLPGNFSLFGSMTGQLSNRPLLASEEIALGGYSFGRAYDDGEVAGDSGWAAFIELRYNHFGVPFLPHGIQYYAFYDAGQVWSKSEARFEGHQNLFSTGLGLRVNLLANLYATAEITSPLNRDVQAEGDREPRAFFSLIAHY